MVLYETRPEQDFHTCNSIPGCLPELIMVVEMRKEQINLCLLYVTARKGFITYQHKDA